MMRKLGIVTEDGPICLHRVSERQLTAWLALMSAAATTKWQAAAAAARERHRAARAALPGLLAQRFALATYVAALVRGPPPF